MGTAEARDCFCQFRMEVLRKPVTKKMEMQPHAYTWKPLCSSVCYKPCFEISQVPIRKCLSITLLLPERVLPPPAAKVRISERNTKEKVNFLFPSASTLAKPKAQTISKPTKQKVGNLRSAKLFDFLWRHEINCLLLQTD